MLAAVVGIFVTEVQYDEKSQTTEALDERMSVVVIDGLTLTSVVADGLQNSKMFVFPRRPPAIFHE